MAEYDSELAAPGAQRMQKVACANGWDARTDYATNMLMVPKGAKPDASTLLRLQRGDQCAVGIWYRSEAGHWSAHKAYTWTKGEVEAERIGIKELGAWIKQPGRNENGDTGGG